MSGDHKLLAEDWLEGLLSTHEPSPHSVECRWPPYHTLLLGEDNGERATVLVFAHDAPDPYLAVKVARGSAAMDSLQNESEILLRLGALSDNNPGRRISPLPFSFRDFGSFAALVQEGLDGETLFRRLRTPPGIAPTALTSLTEELLDSMTTLGRGISDDSEVSDSGRKADADEWKSCVDELASRLDIPAREREDPGGILGKLKRKIDGCEVRMFQHGDLFPKNILFLRRSTREGIRVIDWADAGFHLPPLFDAVLLFATLWHSNTGPLTERERLDHFQSIFWKSAPISPLVDKAFREGRDLWRLGEDWTREDLVFLALAVYARRIAARYGTGHGEFGILMKNARHALAQLQAAR